MDGAEPTIAVSAETETIDYVTGDGTRRSVPGGQTIRVQVRPGAQFGWRRIVDLLHNARHILEAFELPEEQIEIALQELAATYGGAAQTTMDSMRETNLLFHREYSRPSFPRQEWRGPELRGAWTDELAEPPTQAADECTGRDTYVEMPSTGKGDPFADLMSRIDDLTE